MVYAAKVFAFLARIVVSVSNKLSIGAVLGLAALPLMPLGAASGIGSGDIKPGPASIEIVRARPVPLTEEAPRDHGIEIAARRREKREAPPETEEPTSPTAGSPSASRVARSARVHARKTSSISPAEPERALPPIPAETKPAEAVQAEPAKPDVWSEAQIIGALRECVRLLAPISAEVEVSEPLKHEQCGAPAPVAVRRIGSGANKVEISPPAVVNCAMVASLHTWVERTLQPAAQEAFGSPIARLRNASGYACRARIGSHVNSDRLSEHALANAIDIAGFVTADGRTIDLARHWGPTARDQREAERIAATRMKEADPPHNKAGLRKPAVASNPKVSGISHAGPETKKAGKRTSPLRTAELNRLGRGTSDVSADPKAVPATPAPGLEDAVSKSAEAQFLRRLHKGACGVFGTVLGPEVNEAHRDHFHFDLAHRRRSAYCQ